MRICIFGAGSLGSALGGLLSLKNQVTLIGRKEHMAAVRKNGLELTGDVRKVTWPDASVTVEGVEPPELLVISTKAYDTAEAIATCRKWAYGETRVLTLQNGLGNLEMLREWKGKMALGGTTTLGAALLSPGVVRVSGLGETIIGADLGVQPANDIAATLNSSGIPASTSEDVFAEIWSKAVVSACMNPTTAVLRIPNGDLLRSRVVLRLLDSICSECVGIAHACDVDLDARTIRQRIRSIANDTARNVSSMFQDVQRGRRTEIGQINGAFCSYAERHGLPSPLNHALTAMIESLEAQSGRQKG